MAGGNHDTARSAELLDVVGNRGRGHVVVGQHHRNPCGGDDLGNGTSGVAGQEARVIANNDAALGIFVLEDVTGNRSGHAAHVVKGEIVGNKAAPAVGTEFDLGHSPSLVVSRWSLVVRKGLLTTSDQRPSHQFLQLLLIQMLHHFADILGLVERGDEQRVIGLDNHQVAHSDQGNKLAGRVNVIVF